MDSTAVQAILPATDHPFPAHNVLIELPSGGSITRLQSAEMRVYSLRYALVKRALDVLLSGILMVLLLPLILVVASCIRFSSPGSILYTEKRIGRFGIPFTIYKFRTMHTAEYIRDVMKLEMTEEHLAHWRTFGKCSADPRITAVGNLLRKWSLDELPQLYNVFLGEMSLVGPRPIVAKEHDLYGLSGRFYDMAVPGITGLWQVSGRSDISFKERINLDCDYAIEWRLLLDIQILAKTFSAVIRKQGAY